MQPIVKNKYKDIISPGFDVLIMRPTRWGNPFPIGADDRTTVLYKFEQWLLSGNSFGNCNASADARNAILTNLHLLKGRNLICCCAPLPCHGDILLKLANET